MALKDALLPEFDAEMANTRKCLERLPDDKFGFKPHVKSWPMGTLASHLARVPSWVQFTLAMNELRPRGAADAGAEHPVHVDGRSPRCI